MSGLRAGLLGFSIVMAGALPDRVEAGDPERFGKGTFVVSAQVGGGAQLAVPSDPTGVSYVNLTPHLGYLPLDPIASGWVREALELGLEGWFQWYVQPDSTPVAGGVKTVARYHFLSLGRVIPYVEATAGVGASGLRVQEIRSAHNFVLEAGAGASYMITDTLAFTAGFRFQHLSNGHTERPNRGIDSAGGTVGVSIFFDPNA